MRIGRANPLTEIRGVNYGKLRRKNLCLFLCLFVAGAVTEMKLLSAERAGLHNP
jgi:hypothetical protein